MSQEKKPNNSFFNIYIYADIKIGKRQGSLNRIGILESWWEAQCEKMPTMFGSPSKTSKIILSIFWCISYNHRIIYTSIYCNHIWTAAHHCCYCTSGKLINSPMEKAYRVWQGEEQFKKIGSNSRHGREKNLSDAENSVNFYPSVTNRE